MKIIDAHQHVFWYNHDDHWLVREMNELGIARAWLLTWYYPPDENNPSYHRVSNPIHMRADGTHAAMPLEDILLAKRTYPDRFVVGYCPPPTIGDAAQLFEAAYHMHGARVCGEYSYRTVLDDPRAILLFRKAGELRCPVLLHMDMPFLPDEQGKPVYYPFWVAGGIDRLERAMQACPNTIFIGHAPAFWREISGSAERDTQVYPDGPITPGGKLYDLMDRYPNLHADLSASSALTALKRDVKIGREFIVRYADRLLYARDEYGRRLLDFLASLDLPEAVLRKIYHENAERLVPDE